MCLCSLPRLQAAAWREYLAWERSNPQRLDMPTYVARCAPHAAARCSDLPAEQAAAGRILVTVRSSHPTSTHSTHCSVSLAFEQALMVLFHYPDIWLEFAAWHQANGSGGAAAAAVLDKGRAALPSALTLHFAAADLQVGQEMGWDERCGCLLCGLHCLALSFVGCQLPFCWFALYSGCELHAAPSPCRRRWGPPLPPK